MGVLQGSILGPTLFYINNVALAAGESLIHLYADDTILYTSGPSLDTVLTTLQASFNAIQLSFRWMQSITVQSVLSPKPHILPTIATCTLSLAGPRFIFFAKPTGSMSSTRPC